VLVVPDKDEDRYPPYREIAEAAGPLPRIERATVDGAETRPAGTVICSAPPWNLIFE
jgi:hypothetical protein